MAKLLDTDGLLYFWTKLKGFFVEKEAGKGLSANDYTAEEKAKLGGIAAGANSYTHPSYSAKAAGLYKVTVDASGHVSAAAAVAKSDITGLGIPGQDTTYTPATADANGLMSKEDKAKLDGVAALAQVNVIEAIKINGTAQSITSKAVNLTIPTNNNQLTNGAGYQTSAQVQAAVAAAPHLKRSIVASLPAVASADAHTIYMVPITGATGSNTHKEWMAIDGRWEQIGDSAVDLTGYLKSSDLVAVTNAEIDTIVAS